jgi:hypothetical protein
MDRRTFLKTVPAVAMLAATAPSFAQEAAPANPAGQLKPIALPKPEKDGGTSVLASLWQRKTTRTIKPDALPPQMLSNLLWAAWGVNRPDGRRTAASASNSQEIDLYVILPEGIYLYDGPAHSLTPILAGDHRSKVGRGQGGAMAKAPVNLVFVADIAKYSRGRPQEPGLKDPEIQKSYSNIAIGLIAGNVFLFAASQGLAAWFHNCNKPALTEAMKLRPEQRVFYAQTVGYPA